MNTIRLYIAPESASFHQPLHLSDLSSASPPEALSGDCWKKIPLMMDFFRKMYCLGRVCNEISKREKALVAEAQAELGGGGTHYYVRGLLSSPEAKIT